MTETTPGVRSEFPGPDDVVNWEILKTLAQRPHPLLKPGGTSGDTSDLHYSVAEVLYEALTVHHLLDMAGVPRGFGMDTRNIDSRTLIAIMGMGNLRERLSRISGWHQRETGPAGTVGDFCTECEHRWPCDTRRMADGTWKDDDDAAPDPEG
jgi:hypothetical protein